MNEEKQLQSSLEEPAETPEEKNGWHFSRSYIKWIVLAIVVALIVIYLAGAFYYRNRFYGDMVINGTKVGGMTVPVAEKLFTDDMDSHKIALKEKERTEILDPAKADAVISVGTQIQDLKDSFGPWAWFLHLVGKQDYTITLDVSFDDSELKAMIDDLDCFKTENVIAPQDAYLKAGDTEFEIVPEVPGNTVKKTKLVEAVEEALSSGSTTIDLEEADLYKLPNRFEKDEDMQQALSTANKYAQSVIVYDFQYTTETVDYSITKDWIQVSDDLTVTVSDSDAGDYVQELCNKYNTMGGSRQFTTANGATINAYGGDYGWKIYFDEEKEKLIKNVKSGKTVNREPVYSYEAMCRNSASDDLGNSYVEVSISAQEVWLFIDGECKVSSSCVTGMKGSYDTTTGVYSITYKKSPDTLEGLNSNGTSYSSDVMYWMPFNGNQGLHDATWRNSFGGNIYASNGSHGCVNLPYSTAEVIYQYVDAGFPVVIY